MSRRAITLIVVAVLIAGLIGALVILRNRTPEEAETISSTASERTPLLQIPREEIELVTVTQDSGEVAVEAAGDGAFEVVYPYEVVFSQTRVNRIVSGAASISARRTVEEEPEDLAVYGLDEPRATITVRKTDDTQEQLLVGRQTPARDSFYVKKSDDATVYLVYNTWITPFLYSIDELRDKTIPQINTQELTRLEIDTTAGRRITVRRVEEGEFDDDPELAFNAYVVEQPYRRQFGFAGQFLETLTNELSTLRILRFVDDQPDNLAQYGLNPPRARLYVADGRNQLQILFGEQTDGGRYASFGFGQNVFIMSGGEELIAASPYSVVSTFALILNIDLVDDFVVTYKDARYTGAIEREWPDGEPPEEGETDENGEEIEPIETYFLNGEEIDEDSFRDLYQWAIGLLMDTEAPDNPTYREPAVTITYSLTDGTSKSVEFVPYNSNFYAVFRDGISEFLISRAKLDRMHRAFDEALAAVSAE